MADFTKNIVKPGPDVRPVAEFFAAPVQAAAEGISSAHFSNDEMKCKCGCGENECEQPLYDALEKLRAAVSKALGKDTPLHVNSAYRCSKHNKAVGGAYTSQHVLGRAADVRVSGQTPAWLEKIARTIPEIKGIGRDDHKMFVHVDVRKTPAAQWCYGPSGETVKYYLAA
jgi:hypothetical protein